MLRMGRASFSGGRSLLFRGEPSLRAWAPRSRTGHSAHDGGTFTLAGPCFVVGGETFANGRNRLRRRHVGLVVRGITFMRVGARSRDEMHACAREHEAWALEHDAVRLRREPRGTKNGGGISEPNRVVAARQANAFERRPRRAVAEPCAPQRALVLLRTSGAFASGSAAPVNERVAPRPREVSLRPTKLGLRTKRRSPPSRRRRPR